MKRMSTILLTALMIATAAAGSAHAWGFDVGICGADYYASRSPECDLVLTFSNLVIPDRLAPIEIWTPPYPSPVGPSGSYELIHVVVNYTTPLAYRMEVLDRTSGRVLGRASVSIASDGDYFEFILGGRCDLAAVEPMETIYWIGPDEPEPPVEPKPEKVSEPSDEDEGLIYGGLKNNGAEETKSWSSVKAIYR
jgi:hypothetical protein